MVYVFLYIMLNLFINLFQIHVQGLNVDLARSARCAATTPNACAPHRATEDVTGRGVHSAEQTEKTIQTIARCSNSIVDTVEMWKSTTMENAKVSYFANIVLQYRKVVNGPGL